MNVLSNLSLNEKVAGYGAFAALLYGGIVVHECSHLIAMRTLFTNIDPYIEINLHKMSYAYYNGDPIIRPELPMTEKTGFGLVSAAGPLADITLTVIGTMIALKMQETNKKTSLLFASCVCAYALNVLYYCADSLRTNYGDYHEMEMYLGIPGSVQLIITGTLALGVTLLMKNILFSQNSQK